MTSRSGSAGSDPAGSDPDEISPVVQDYLKVIWSATEWGAPPISTKALAKRFGTTQANVSETVKRLAGQGLVVYRPYQPVVLTERGTALALAMVRRHRLVECFLVTTVGYDWDEVHDEAERLEHAVSEQLISRIDQLLGHPTADPHGDPIPTPEGVVVRPVDTIRLTDAEPGRYRVVRVSDADSDQLAELLRRGVQPDVTVVVRAEPVTAERTILGPRGSPITAAEAVLIRVRLLTSRPADELAD